MDGGFLRFSNCTGCWQPKAPQATAGADTVSQEAEGDKGHCSGKGVSLLTTCPPVSASLEVGIRKENQESYVVTGRYLTIFLNILSVSFIITSINFNM